MQHFDTNSFLFITFKDTKLPYRGGGGGAGGSLFVRLFQQELRHILFLWPFFLIFAKLKFCCLGQSFFIFRFTDPLDPIFWKLKKK